MQVTEKDNEFIKKWENTRKNKWRYIVLKFVLLWGVLATVSSLIFEQIDFLEVETTPMDIAFRALLFMLIGFIVGNVQYEGLEKRYHELIAEQKDLS